MGVGDLPPESAAADWPAEVTDFLSRHLPRATDRDGFDHYFSSAYEMGCGALVALGQAEDTPWGAIPLAVPRRPDVPPRWDDVCCAVLGLAVQHGGLEYCLPDGGKMEAPIPRLELWTLRGPEAPPPPSPIISASAGLGAAHATPDVLSVLEALGLYSKGRWTTAAELVFWREQPRDWAMDVTTDPRFSNAFEHAVRTVPEDVHADMDRLVTVTNKEVAAAMDAHIAHNEKVRAKYGPKARLGRPPTIKRTRSGLEFARCNELDWLFYRRWRLVDGWLSPNDAEAALDIFHDPLAISMRRKVVARLYPAATSMCR